MEQEDQTFDGVMAKILARPDFVEKCRGFIAGLNFGKYRPDGSLEVRNALHEGVRTYLCTRDITLAEKAIRDNIDEEGRIFELATSINESEFIDKISAELAETAFREYQQVDFETCLATAGKTLGAELVDMALARDKGNPLDIAEEMEITVCFIPGSHAEEDYVDVATSSWIKRSSSVSIKPDGVFTKFLEVVGVEKDEWLEAVSKFALPGNIKSMSRHEHERAQAWSDVLAWKCDGSLDMELDDLVSAVDACPFGFTPVIAFRMRASDLFSMDFSETMVVTGGIVGLHDFKNGAGDPKRFEGTLRFKPEPGDIHLADDRPLGLIATHGFLSSSFRSTVEIVPSLKHEAGYPGISL